jgi:hypothetical protein
MKAAHQLDEGLQAVHRLSSHTLFALLPSKTEFLPNSGKALLQRLFQTGNLQRFELSSTHYL